MGVRQMMQRLLTYNTPSQWLTECVCVCVWVARSDRTGMRWHNILFGAESGRYRLRCMMSVKQDLQSAA